MASKRKPAKIRQLLKVFAGVTALQPVSVSYTLKDVKRALDKTGLTLVFTPVFNPILQRHSYGVSLVRKLHGVPAVWEATGSFDEIIAALMTTAGVE